MILHVSPPYLQLFLANSISMQCMCVQFIWPFSAKPSASEVFIEKQDRNVCYIPRENCWYLYRLFATQRSAKEVAHEMLMIDFTSTCGLVKFLLIRIIAVCTPYILFIIVIITGMKIWSCSFRYLLLLIKNIIIIEKWSLHFQIQCIYIYIAIYVYHIVMIKLPSTIVFSKIIHQILHQISWIGNHGNINNNIY